MVTEAASREVALRSEAPSRAPAPSFVSSARAQGTEAQVAWAARRLASRLEILRHARHELARRVPGIVAAISSQLARTEADTMVAEILPLLDAIRFLEREAPRLLRPRRLGRRGLPFWLGGIDAEIHRVPFGRILVIGPANYPLFLPGVQVFGALAAGNAVTWKPGLGGAPVAALVADALVRSGLPRSLLTVTEDTVEAAHLALADRPDKVFFTGSGAVGRQLLGQLAETATPAVVELSGSDAVIILPSADLDRVVAALAFGMRLNGSATCMAPRRILLVDATPARRKLLVDRLAAALAAISPAALPAPVQQGLITLVSDAAHDGATVIGDPTSAQLRPILILDATPAMGIAQADLFAPVLTLIAVEGASGVLDAQARCPLALSASIFGGEREARQLASQLNTGTVIINDLIVPTADPRVPFGGRRGSGFGVTRGAEGLLEMTAVKVVSTRQNRSTRQYQPTGSRHAALFAGIIHTAHAASLQGRWAGLKRALTAAMEFNNK